MADVSAGGWTAHLCQVTQNAASENVGSVFGIPAGEAAGLLCTEAIVFVRWQTPN